MKFTQKFSLVVFSFFLLSAYAQTDQDTATLEGTWILDMSPTDITDNNFATMIITSVEDGKIEGSFYREGVAIKNGNLNTSTSKIYGALVSGDNSGAYNTTFYLEDGKLFGTTHSLDRNFLAVWIAVRKQ